MALHQGLRWLAAGAWLAAAPAWAVAAVPATVQVPAVRSSIDSDEAFSPGTVCREVERSLRLLTPSVVVGEPVLLEILLTGRPIPGRYKGEFAGHIAIGRDVKVYVVPQRGRPYEFTLPDANALAPSLAYELRHGETVSSVLVLGYDELSPNGAFAYEPGLYRLQVTMECPRGTDEVVKGGFEVIGEAVFEVRPAEGDDAAALDILGDPKDFLPVQAQSAPRPGDRAKLAQLVEAAPAAALRPYALAALANHFYFTGTAREGDPAALEEAIPLYEKFLAEYPDHVLGRAVRIRLVRAYSYTGRDALAEALFAGMWSDPHLTKLLRPKEELRQWFFGEEPEAVGGIWMLLEDPLDALKPDSADEENKPDPNSMEARLQEALRQLNSKPAQQ